eukprot:TRINITY_DN897_c3_g1_i1.p1 TRINITY_DN897_c3_g1~~TRINITY_DN897_c3_g1_i1.p1  ORF type:complete len:295 (+),score=119.38 TRINITY_DN897_c3_g1_i1:118-1002(+)
MRLIVQRVIEASIKVDGTLISSINRGLAILVGISRDDTTNEAIALSRKLLNLRLWEDQNQKPWSKSVIEMNYEILLVSQFTLYATLKGTKPDFHNSMHASSSKDLFDFFVRQVATTYNAAKVKQGVFGAKMEFQLINDGPVTIPIESLPKNNSSDNQSKPKNNKNKINKMQQPSNILTPEFIRSHLLKQFYKKLLISQIGAISIILLHEYRAQYLTGKCLFDLYFTNLSTLSTPFNFKCFFGPKAHPQADLLFPLTPDYKIKGPFSFIGAIYLTLTQTTTYVSVDTKIKKRLGL